MPLRVLQFSDIHFATNPAGERITHDDVREQAIADIATLDRGKVDALIIAGDIAFSGKRDEYQLAATWIDRVLATSGCSRGSVMTVPGNHDADRDRVKVSTKLIHRSLRSSGLPQATAELASIVEANDPCLTDKLADYQTFAAGYGCFFNGSSKPSWSRTFELAANRTLAFQGLTSVQVCDGDDAKDAMLLGRHQYTIPRTQGVEQVVVVHHPFEWLKDRGEATQYITSRSRVLIVGHEHVQDLQKITTPDDTDRLLLASGALTPENAAAPYIYRYNLLEFDTTDTADGIPCLSVTVVPRIWSPKHTAFRTDHDSLKEGDSATIVLRCPQYKAPLSPSAAPAGTATTHGDDGLVRLRYLFWQRLDWRARMNVLLGVKVLPIAPEAPLPHAVEVQALRQAEETSKLAAVWAAVMEHLPHGERMACPFSISGE